jgi:ribose-phosphate pyrophosphokinase
VDALNPVHLFADEFAEFRGRHDTIGVAPDAGAAAFMIPFCRNMGIRCVVTSKYRIKLEKAAITDIMGDFVGIQNAIIIDDMINTGGTMDAVITKLIQEKGIEKVWIGVSHFLGVDRAIERLKKCQQKYGLQRLVITDSVPSTQDFRQLPFTKVVSLENYLANAIQSIHLNRPLSDQ